MNPLIVHIRLHSLNEIEAMNRLTEAGLISDLAVNASDVCEPDATNAVRYLKMDGALLI